LDVGLHQRPQRLAGVGAAQLGELRGVRLVLRERDLEDGRVAGEAVDLLGVDELGR
jgi:hypothetical protein